MTGARRLGQGRGVWSEESVDVRAGTQPGEAARELVVCDLIGTLVRDRGHIQESVDAAIAHVRPGATVPRERVRSLRGANKGEMFEALAPGSSAEALAAFNEQVEAHLNAGSFEPVRGTTAALAEIRGTGASICLTSGLASRIVAAMVDRFGWSEHVDDVLTGDEVARGRPHPDLVLTAALSAKISGMRRVVVCGDTANDLRAGHNAGAGLCVGVLTGAHNRARLAAAPHNHILKSIAELPALLTSTRPDSAPPAPAGPVSAKPCVPDSTRP